MLQKGGCTEVNCFIMHFLHIIRNITTPINLPSMSLKFPKKFCKSCASNVWKTMLAMQKCIHLAWSLKLEWFSSVAIEIWKVYTKCKSHEPLIPGLKYIYYLLNIIKPWQGQGQGKMKVTIFIVVETLLKRFFNLFLSFRLKCYFMFLTQKSTLPFLFLFSILSIKNTRINLHSVYW